MAHILVMNDDATVLRMFEALLTHAGHRVTLARANAEALAVLRSSLHPVVAVLWIEPPSPNLANEATARPLLEVIRDHRAGWEPHGYLMLTWQCPVSGAAIDELVTELGIPYLVMPLFPNAILAAVAEVVATSSKHP